MKKWIFLFLICFFISVSSSHSIPPIPFNPKAPGAIGSTTASTGAFTTLSASSTVSGNGFSTYLASPPAIGGTAAAAGTFTNLTATSNGGIVTLSPTGAGTVAVSPAGALTVNPTTASTINNCSIGATTPATGAFTTLVGVKDEIVKAATGTVTAAEMKGQIINNYGQANDATLTLDAAFEGANFTVILGTTVAKYFRLDPNASDKFYVDGTADSDGHYIGIASAVAGAKIHFQAFQTGAGAYDWSVSIDNGAWLPE